MRKVLAIGVVLGLLALGQGARAAETEAFKSGVFDPPRDAPDFELEGSNGPGLTLAKHRGKVVVVAFGFTYCPRICPVTLANLAQVTKKLGPDAKDVQVVFVSVDPERDTPARLKEFLAFFDPSFLGATGSEEKLAAVREAYGIIAKREASQNPKLGYEVHHSSFIYLIDKKGKLRVLVPFGTRPDDVAHDLKLLLAEPGAKS